MPIVGVILGAIGGCARPEGTLFPPVDPAIVWPPPPDPPRIRYVGQLATDKDLRPAKSGWDVFTEAVRAPRTAADVSTPAGVAISEDGKLYVTDPALHVVHLFDLRTRHYQALSEARDQLLVTPADVVVAGGQAYVTDSALHAVFVYDTANQCVRVFGAERLKRPVGIAFCHTRATAGTTTTASDGAAVDDDCVYVVDTGAHACVVFDPDGRERMRFGQRGSGPGEFNYPTDIAVHPQRGIFIADTLNFRVQRFTLDGQFISSIGTRGDGAGSFALPKGVALDESGHIFVVDAQFENIQAFSPEGEFLLALGREGQGPGEFWLPNGIAIGPDGRAWVADSYNRRVQVFQILPEPMP